MRNFQNKWLLMITSVLLLPGAILILLFASPAQADVGVRPILPGGSSIQPESETPIEMRDEVVTMNVRQATEADNSIILLNPAAYGLQFQPIWYAYVAEVLADFTMHNPSSDDVSMTAWFPLASALENLSWEINPDETVPRIARFQVMVNGNPVDYAVSELPNPKGADRPAMPWASFPVRFSAGQDTKLQVTYLLPLQNPVKGSELALYYVFQTGAGWAGPIWKAELIVNLPYPASEETINRMDPTNLDLPYFNANPATSLPFDGVMADNQARWTWTDFEPSPQDDFSIWLVDPGLYQQLESARDAIQATPEDGQSWLDLASIYRMLATRAWNYPAIFAASYLTPGIEAYRKAVEFLPEHPEAHVGLAMLSLAAYMRDANAPGEVMNLVQEQLLIARQLEAAHPNLAEQAELSSDMLGEAMMMYFGNITATAVAGASSTGWVKETEISAIRLTPTMTSTPETDLEGTAIPSRTPVPVPVTPAVAEEEAPESSSIQNLPRSTILVIEIVVFLIISLLVYNRLLRRRG